MARGGRQGDDATEAVADHDGRSLADHGDQVVRPAASTVGAARRRANGRSPDGRSARRRDRGGGGSPCGTTRPGPSMPWTITTRAPAAGSVGGWRRRPARRRRVGAGGRRRGARSRDADEAQRVGGPALVLGRAEQAPPPGRRCAPRPAAGQRRWPGSRLSGSSSPSIRWGAGAPAHGELAHGSLVGAEGRGCWASGRKRAIERTVKPRAGEADDRGASGGRARRAGRPCSWRR